MTSHEKSQKRKIAMYVFVTTENPRPTFNLDMTAAERDLMNRHVAYWSEEAARGISVVFGPVMDPGGVYGMGVHRVRDEFEMRDLIEHDPANGLLKYKIVPMAK